MKPAAKQATVYLYGLIDHIQIELERRIKAIDPALLAEFAKTEEFGDVILDLRSYREYRGQFSLIQQVGPDINHNGVVINLRRQDGIYRLRAGQMLSYNIDNRWFIRLWSYIEVGGQPKFSWRIFTSSELPPQIAIALRESSRFKKELLLRQRQTSRPKPPPPSFKTDGKWKKVPKKTKTSKPMVFQIFSLHPRDGEEWIPGT